MSTTKRMTFEGQEDAVELTLQDVNIGEFMQARVQTPEKPGAVTKPRKSCLTKSRIALFILFLCVVVAVVLVVVFVVLPKTSSSSGSAEDNSNLAPTRSPTLTSVKPVTLAPTFATGGTTSVPTNFPTNYPTKLPTRFPSSTPTMKAVTKLEIESGPISPHILAGVFRAVENSIGLSMHINIENQYEAWRNIIQAGESDMDRLPALFIEPNSMRLHACVNQVSDVACVSSNNEIALNTWHRVDLIYEYNELLLRLDGYDVAFTPTQNPSYSTRDVPVWTGSDFFWGMHGKANFKNLVLGRPWDIPPNDFTAKTSFSDSGSYNVRSSLKSFPIKVSSANKISFTINLMDGPVYPDFRNVIHVGTASLDRSPSIYILPYSRQIHVSYIRADGNLDGFSSNEDLPATGNTEVKVGTNFNSNTLTITFNGRVVGEASYSLYAQGLRKPLWIGSPYDYDAKGTISISNLQLL